MGLEQTPGLGYLDKSEVSGIRSGTLLQETLADNGFFLFLALCDYEILPGLTSPFPGTGTGSFWKLQRFPVPPPCPPWVLALGTGECCLGKTVVTFTDHFR